MGYAIAAAAEKRGADVTLYNRSGGSRLSVGVRLIENETGESTSGCNQKAVCLKRCPDYGSRRGDYRPKATLKEKIEKGKI
jgi:phosphopantothenoylcysteine synthetase/decarboxylase